MLTFLRKIRKSLIGSGTAVKIASPSNGAHSLWRRLAGRYVLYAIGEIALVVLGILIALQINNWNDSNIMKRFERKALNEINTSLSADIVALNQSLEVQETLAHNNALILQLYELENYDKIQLGRLVSSSAQHLEIVFQTSAFESLRSRGIDLVSDDSIRVKLLDLYDIAYPQLLIEFENYNIHLRNEWRPYMINNFSYNSSDAPHPTDVEFYRYPLNWKKLRRDDIGKNIILLNQFITYTSAIKTKEILKQVAQLKQLIEKYLN